MPAIQHSLMRLTKSAVAQVHGAQRLLVPDALTQVTHSGKARTTEAMLSLSYLGRKDLENEFRFFFERSSGEVSHEAYGTGNLLWFLRQTVRSTRAAATHDVSIVDALGGWTPVQGKFHRYSPYLRAVLPLKRTFDEQLSLIRSKGQRRRLGKIFGGSYAWRESHAPADFDRFYDTMYLPHTGDRHRRDAHVFSRAEMASVFASKGALVFVTEGGEPVCGGLFYRSSIDPDTLYYWRNGIASSKGLDSGTLGERNAALDACAMQYGVEQGFARVDFGLAHALLDDGGFVHKRRLGCDFHAPENTPDFFLSLRPDKELEVLRSLPLIFSTPSGLTGHVVIDRLDSEASIQDFIGAIRDCTFPSLRQLDVHTRRIDRQSTALAAAVSELRQELPTRLELHEDLAEVALPVPIVTETASPTREAITP